MLMVLHQYIGLWLIYYLLTDFDFINHGVPVALPKLEVELIICIIIFKL